jgi:hypothetical protein
LAPQNVFNRQLCLEHDEKLVSYLSLLRDIEMRTKQIQPLEFNLVELQDLLCQAKVGSQKLQTGLLALRKPSLASLEISRLKRTCLAFYTRVKSLRALLSNLRVD